MLNNESIDANTFTYEKINKLVIKMAFNTVESTYGCFLLIIDRYRKEKESVYAIIGSGADKNPVAIRNAL